MIVIVGAPGGGTSFFTKFLRYNGFYAGKSIEDGKFNKDHIGYLYNRKWHESITYSKNFCKYILKSLGVSPKEYEKLFGSSYQKIIDKISNNTQQALECFKEDNLDTMTRMYNDEFPDQSIPHGYKNPRNFLILPFIKEAYPFAKILTVQRSKNTNPSKHDPEGRAFSKRIKDSNYVKAVYGHEDDFRFQFEDFMNVDKVNEVLEFVGLGTISVEELHTQLKKLDFDVSKIK